MRITLLLLIVFSTYNLNAQITTSNKRELFQSWQQLTVSLGVIDTINGMPKYKAIGSGVVFYVKYRGKAVNVIITAKHVLFDDKGEKRSYVRFRKSWFDDRSVDYYYGYNISLEDNFFTLTDPDVDLAAFFQLTTPKDWQEYENKYGPDNDTMYHSLMPYSWFADVGDYYEGCDIFTIGYPEGLNDKYHTRGLIRKGLISWIPSRGIDKTKFLIDCDVYPGNSGGPVFALPEMFSGETTKFMGIVIQRQFEKKSVQDKRLEKSVKDSEGNDIMSLESMGIGIVEPVNNVRKLLYEVEQEINQNTKWASVFEGL